MVVRGLQVDSYRSFGMQMEARVAAYVNKSYKYGFNGKEGDVESFSQCVAFEARIYDSRLGRFFSTDPWEYKYVWQTPYAFIHCNPIAFVDFLGMGDPPNSTDGYSEGDEYRDINDGSLYALLPNKKSGELEWVYAGDEFKEVVVDHRIGPRLPDGSFNAPKVQQVSDYERKRVQDLIGLPSVLNKDQNEALIPNAPLIVVTTSAAAEASSSIPRTLAKNVVKSNPLTLTVGLVLLPTDGGGPTKGPVKPDDLPNIYIHYTNELNFHNIAATQKIRSFNSSNTVYLTKTFFSPKMAENYLFLGQKPGHGDYMVVFKVQADQQAEIVPVPGNIHEFQYIRGTLRIRPGNMIYQGPNIIPD